MRTTQPASQHPGWMPVYDEIVSHSLPASSKRSGFCSRIPRYQGREGDDLHPERISAEQIPNDGRSWVVVMWLTPKKV